MRSDKLILILGAKGMLGSELSVIFADLQPICWDIDDLDITNEEIVQKRIREISPSIIINASAYTDVDGAEDNQEQANRINGTAVGHLAKTAQTIGAKLIHYSTDYVFSGTNKSGYKENDDTNPVNAYGYSKLQGEQAIQNTCKEYYIIRTSWLYGKNGKNFVDTMLNIGNKQKEIQVVNDQFGKPTYTVDLALRTRRLIEDKLPYGVYHITNEGQVSWFEFAKKVFDLVDMPVSVLPVASDKFPRPAKRPNYSSLINTKIPTSREWQVALNEYISKR
ncbi:dTDP-4-dehydrorhamnose reductase [Patescibacteria group bacterium]|nr:dTDP-4-dehydrorhamnose reductase [Patescibacteria group bacterium]